MNRIVPEGVKQYMDEVKKELGIKHTIYSRYDEDENGSYIYDVVATKSEGVVYFIKLSQTMSSDRILDIISYHIAKLDEIVKAIKDNKELIQ